MIKLTQAEVDEIRRLRKHTEMSYRELAETYGITKGNVGHILNGRSWIHNKETP
jgi:DNA-binding transcriptional regulator YiaG